MPKFPRRKGSRLIAAGLAANALLTGAGLAYAGYRKLSSYRSKRNKTGQRLRGRLPVVRRTIRRRLNQRATSQGTGGSFSKFFYGRNRLHPVLKKLYASTSKQYYARDSSTQLSATPGRQNFKVVQVMFDKTDLGYLKNTLNEGSSQATAKACYESCTAEIMLSNLTNTNLRVVIYDVVSRRDRYSNVLPTIESEFDAAIFEENDTTGTTTCTALPFNIFTADRFTQFFKVLKMTHILMAEGQTHSHRVHWAPNKVMNGTQITCGGYNIKGLTCFQIIQVYGTPAEISETETVTTTDPHLAVVCKKSYRYGYISNNYTTTNLETSLTNEGTCEIIDIASGNPETEVEA